MCIRFVRCRATGVQTLCILGDTQPLCICVVCSRVTDARPCVFLQSLRVALVATCIIITQGCGITVLQKERQPVAEGASANGRRSVSQWQKERQLVAEGALANGRRSISLW